MNKRDKTKLLFGLLSILMGAIVIWQWSYIHNSYTPNVNQLDSSARVEQFLEAHFKSSGSQDSQSLMKSSVGMLVESLKFNSANDVEVSGYIWQKISAVDKQKITPGLVFVDAIGDVVFEKRYSQSADAYDLHGWYFEASLRQPFQYSDYPIDHKTMWIKVKSPGFNQGHILLPDLESYQKTGLGDLFGVSSHIVLLGWELNESFFDYILEDYDTDFGLNNASHHLHLPVLAFNIVLNRNLITAFMVNITLLLVTMFLLFILVVMITSDKELKEEFGVSVGNAVASCAGLFFAVLMAHIHLREQFPSTGFIYLEFFYLLNYLFITIAALIIFSFYNKAASNSWAIFKDDALWVKLLFWPTYFGVAILYTYLHFH